MIGNRRAIAFLGGAFLFIVIFVGVAGKRQGWFASSVSFEAEFSTGDGLNVGAPVLISGLKVGQVEAIDLNAENKVIVKMRLQNKFAKHIKVDSKAVLGRPFIIGEKVISLTSGGQNSTLLSSGARIKGEENLEITDLLSGGRMGPYFKTFSALMDQLRIVVEGDGSPDSVSIVDLYRQANRSLKSIEMASSELRIIRTEFATSPDTKKLIRELAASTGQLHSALAQVEANLPALSVVSQEFLKMTPEISKALKETVFTLQAMQRSFILSGGVARLKEEKARFDNEEAAKKNERVPASVP